MSHAIRNSGIAPEDLRTLYALVRPELDQVEKILCEELHSESAFVDRLAKHGFRLGGKRLRPALVLLSAKACGNLNPQHLVLAASVEMIHTASLIHDDVLDEATIRRHLETVNARWDNEASVLLGDYLLARSLCLVSSLESTFACREIAEASRVMCEGELRQVAGRANYDLSEEDYLDIIADKTAALCGPCCCRLGAHYAGADAEVRDAFGRFGSHVGVAFQIIDDILDVLGDEAKMGKSLGTDLAKEKPTLPLIRLLSRSGPAERAEVLAILSGQDNHRRQVLRPWLERADTIAYSQQKAAEYVLAAMRELDQVPAGPAIDSMRRLAEFVIRRQH